MDRLKIQSLARVVFGYLFTVAMLSVYGGQV